MPEAVAKKKRMPEFDVAKAIALVAVMFTHSNIAGTGGSLFQLARDFCFTFHRSASPGPPSPATPARSCCPTS